MDLGVKRGGSPDDIKDDSFDWFVAKTFVHNICLSSNRDRIYFVSYLAYSNSEGLALERRGRIGLAAFPTPSDVLYRKITTRRTS
jgi:hypothetical protein